MITAEGCLYKIRMGYAGVGLFRMKLAEAYNKDFGRIYEKFIRSAFPFGEPLTEAEEKEWDAIMESDVNGKIVDKFFTCPDCDATFSSRECKALLETFKDVSLDFTATDRITEEEYNVLECLKEMLKYCCENKEKLYFI